MVETSMTFSTCVVYNICCLGTFNFFGIGVRFLLSLEPVEFLCFFIPLSIQCKV